MFTLRLFKIKKHSRRVLILKRSLPIFAFLCAAVILIWPTLIEQKDKFSLPQKPSQETASKINMQQVRFFSVDDKKQELVVTAASVQETDPDKQVVTLENPQAVFNMRTGEKLTSKTSYGFVFQKEEYLYFEDEVYSSTDSGYRAYSSEVICDYKKNTMDSDAPVRVTGPTGTLNADGFYLYNKADNIDFKGKTHTLIYDNQGNITITSLNGLLIDQVNLTITVVKNAVMKQQDKTVKADKIILYYTQNKNDRIQKAIAIGHVEAWTPKEKIMGDRGEYNPKTGLITMTGNVILTQGDNKMSGSKAFMNMKTGVSSLSQDKNGKSNGRVKGTLTPGQVK